jgi:hypothetical protein
MGTVSTRSTTHPIRPRLHRVESLLRLPQIHLRPRLLAATRLQQFPRHGTFWIDALYTLASPMVGDSTFVNVFNGLALNSWRIINEQDVVRILPPFPPTYRHVDTEQQYDSREKVQQSVSCCHAVATYLSLIDPTLKPDPSCQLPSAA